MIRSIAIAAPFVALMIAFPAKAPTSEYRVIATYTDSYMPLPDKHRCELMASRILIDMQAAIDVKALDGEATTRCEKVK